MIVLILIALVLIVLGAVLVLSGMAWGLFVGLIGCIIIWLVLPRV